MDRSLVVIFFVVTILFSGGEATNFHDIWNLALPHSTSPVATTADQSSQRSVPVNEEAGDHSKTSVDFGTKGWPFVYYSRRDAKGTVDWGTKAWPYIYYYKNEGKNDVTDAVIPSVIQSGRKVGSGFKG